MYVCVYVCIYVYVYVYVANGEKVNLESHVSKRMECLRQIFENLSDLFWSRFLKVGTNSLFTLLEERVMCDLKRLKNRLLICTLSTKDALFIQSRQKNAYDWQNMQECEYICAKE